VNVRRKKAGRLEAGEVVRVAAGCGGAFDGGGHFELRGDVGRVVGANPHYRGKDGIRRTAVELPNGAIVTVPTRALVRD
jgi:hypothetical protein